MIHTMRNLQIRLEDNLINFYQNLPEREQSKVVFTLPQFQNRSFLQAINRSLNISKNISKGQGLTINSFTEQCSPPLVNSPNVTFSPQMTSSPKSMSRNSLAGIDYGSLSNSKFSAKIKAKFGIFLHRKSELEAEIEELLCLENDNSVQSATLKLRAIDLRDRLTSLPGLTEILIKLIPKA